MQVASAVYILNLFISKHQGLSLWLTRRLLDAWKASDVDTRLSQNGVLLFLRSLLRVAQVNYPGHETLSLSLLIIRVLGAFSIEDLGLIDLTWKREKAISREDRVLLRLAWRRDDILRGDRGVSTDHVDRLIVSTRNYLARILVCEERPLLVILKYTIPLWEASNRQSLPRTHSILIFENGCSA